MSVELAGLGTWLRRALTSNWPTKATALVLATLLWAVVQAKQPTTQLVPVRFEVDLPPGLILAEPLPLIQALYAGPASELIKLYATPPVIRRQLVDSVTAIELSLGDLSIARDIDANAQDVQPRRLSIRLQRALPVRPDQPAPAPPTTESVTERVLMGVPVQLPRQLRGLHPDPPAVAVTVRGSASRLRRLTRDSLRVSVPDRPAVAGAWVRTTVSASAGLAATVTPDSIRLLGPPRG